MKKLIAKRFRINREKLNNLPKIHRQVQLVGLRYFKPVGKFNSPVDIWFSEDFITQDVFISFKQLIEEDIPDSLKSVNQLRQKCGYPPIKIIESI